MDDRNATTVLVTGVGDTVGQALVKTARHSALPCRVMGMDRDEHAVGLQWVDKAFVLPHCSQVGPYLVETRRICAEEGVRLILPGSEKELELLSQQAETLREETGAIVVASPPEVLRIAMNKWETCRFLEGAGLNFPGYAKADAPDQIERLIEKVGFPLFAKPCRGTGARGVMKIESRKDLDAVRAVDVEMVVQEYLQPDEEEYSVEAFTLKNGRQVGTICYRRGQLIAGDTYKARILSHPAVEAEALAIAKALRPSGPCNIQLRMTERGPVAFEINPRFSGGVSMRAHFGYNEVEMAIRDLLLDEPVTQPRVGSGLALRFWEELYLDERMAPVAEP